MTKGAFRLPISTGGSTPDPATYCPANGYILNPINPSDGWFLIASFQTNSPNSTTFDPAITTSSGQYAWDLGDGTIIMYDKAISHTYATTATRTVKLYGKGTCAITSVDFNGDNIVGTLDVSNSVFAAVTSWILNTNTAMTSVIFPSIITAPPSLLYIYSTGITGTLDLSMFTAYASGCQIQLDTNPSMTGVNFASSVTGTINRIYLNSTGITGTLDLSMFTSFSSIGAIVVHTNPSMTGINFASSITGTFVTLFIYGTGITGTLDLSMFNTYSAAADVRLQSNPSMTGINFPSSTITGIIKTLYLYSNSSLGYVDITKLKTGIASLDWRFNSNGWSAAIVNHVLVDSDGISASGFTGRVINIGGTNADPDTTSGGYNGSAARTSLQGKSFTVTIT